MRKIYVKCAYLRFLMYKTSLYGTFITPIWFGDLLKHKTYFKPGNYPTPQKFYYRFIKAKVNFYKKNILFLTTKFISF